MMTTTVPATARQVDYAMSLVERLAGNWPKFGANQRASWYDQTLSSKAYGRGLLEVAESLGVQRAELPPVVADEVRAHLVDAEIERALAMSMRTREAVAAMPRAEVSALIDELKGRSW